MTHLVRRSLSGSLGRRPSGARWLAASVALLAASAFAAPTRGPSPGESELDRASAQLTGSARLAGSAQLAGSADTTVPTLDSLLARFARVRGLSARFREEKRIALLRNPLVNEGFVYYEPGRLARHTERPERSVVVLQDGRLVIIDAKGHSRSLDVNSSPVLAAFVRSFLDVLRGDRAALERTFALEFTAQAEHWTLTLTPRSEALKKLITRMSLRGNQLELETLRIDEGTGDHSETQFSSVRLDRTFSTQERAKYFPKASGR